MAEHLLKFIWRIAVTSIKSKTKQTKREIKKRKKTQKTNKQNKDIKQKWDETYPTEFSNDTGFTIVGT